MKKIINDIKSIPSCNLICILIIIPFFMLLTSFAVDNDFWFTINQGRYVIENGFPIKAINSIHDLDFIYQSWGSGVLFYLIYHYLGNYGIIAFLIIISELLAFFFYKTCMVVSNNKRLSLLLTIMVMILYCTCFFTTRPHIFTTLNMVIMFYLLEKYYHTLNKKYLLFVPLIGLLQINMHGIYFILLLVFMGTYLVDSFKIKIGKIETQNIKKKELIVTFVATLLVGLINPYTYKTIIYGFSSYSSSGTMNNMIIELLAPNFHDTIGRVFILTIIVVNILYFKSHKKISVRHYLLLLGTSYLAFDALKSFWLFLFSSLFPLAYILSKDNELKEHIYSKKYYVTQYLIAFCVIMGIVLNITISSLPDSDKFINYLDKIVIDKEKTKLYTGFADGSYAQWRGYFTYIDPRAEVFLKSNNHKFDILEEYNDLQKLKIDYRDFLNKYQFDYLFISKEDEVLYSLLKIDNMGYEILLEDDNYQLFGIKKAISN